MTKNPLTAIQKFIKIESLSGILLFGATIIALIWANSSFGGVYESIWSYKLGVQTEGFTLVKPLILWVNDGLMAIFFFLIGLEIKRELTIGELNSVKKATFPVFAAIGGMAIPALLFFILNKNPETLSGWAVPMATDIAFSLAILKVLGKRAPLGLKVFLTAFAIVDDLGAVLIIAIFYSNGIKWMLVCIALLLIIFLFVLARRNFYSKYVLVIVGLIVWYLFLKSGMHPTIAGVLLAFTVPIRSRATWSDFTDSLEKISQKFKNYLVEGNAVLNKDRIEEVDQLEDLTKQVRSPLLHLEHKLHDWVAYFIMPIFALANAGVIVDAGVEMDKGLILAIALALVLGNAVGVFLMSQLALKTGLTVLPQGVKNIQILGVAFLAGVGFTMSMFIANLAFAESQLFLDSAKIGILIGSFVSGLLGYLILFFTGRTENVH